MSFTQHSISVSIIKLESSQTQPSKEKAELTCCLFLNSHLLAISKIDDTQDPAKIFNAFPQDTLQLIFYKNSQKELFGSVSFILGQVLKNSQNQIVQWITLSEDSDNDAFNQSFEEEGQGWPRALISFEIQKNSEASRRQSDQHKTTFEAYLKQKEHEIDQQQCSESASFELSYNNTAQKLNRFPIDLDENTENFLVRPASRNSIDNFNLENNDYIINNLTNSGCVENNRVENSLGMPNQVNSHREIDDMQGIETCASIGSLKWEKQAVSRSFNLGLDLTNYLAKEKLNLRDDVLKQNFLNKDEELNTLLENLQENKNGEDLHATHFTTMQAENDTLRENCQRYEMLMEDLNRHVKDLESKLKTQESAQFALLEENKSLALTIHRKQQAYELLAKQLDEVIKSEDCSCNILKEESRQETYKNENYKLAKELGLLKSQLSLSEAMVSNFQNEVRNLKEKEDEADSIKAELNEALQRVSYYEESFIGLINKCGFSELQEKMDFESLGDFMMSIQNELARKIVELNEMKSNVESLTMELYHSKDHQAGSLYGQDSHHKDQMRSLEQERDSLKDELFKANDNYMKLTNKYMELSDTLEKLQKTTQTNQPAPTLKTTTPRVTGQAHTKTHKNIEEGIDEIETKLIQFLIYYKIQPSILTRVEKGIYLYNEKKVSLRICNGHLVVKVGDGYKPLQEFLKVKNNNSMLQSRSLKTLNNNKPAKREERSFEKKSKFGLSNYFTNQLIENTQPDISCELTTSRSIVRESTKNTTRYQSNIAATERPRQDTEGKQLSTGNLRLKEILLSRSVEKKTSTSFYRSKDKSYRELTLL